MKESFNIKLAIHHSGHSFSECWIKYCDQNQISWKLVDCYKNDISEQLSDCDALMWHFNHKSPKASKFAKQLLFSVYASGKKIFPDFNTMWHFDDKVAQKYLLELLEVPFVTTYVFYTKKEAFEWAQATSFPKVFKLRNGAGSDNVRLIGSRKQAFKIINKAFGSGFKQYDGWYNLNERVRKFKVGKISFWSVFKGLLRLFHKTEYARVTEKEIGYVYFQDFIPGNDHDIRVIVIGNKAFAIKRLVRKKDFRASGSGFIQYEKENIDDNLIRLSFEISKKLRSQCMAFDFIHDRGHPVIIEISYGFAMEGYDACPGYWDDSIVWHEGKFNPYGWMVDNLIQEITRNNHQ